jgi:DNA repair protein RadC
MGILNEWQESDKPREKLMQHGAKTLSTPELIAILMGTGTVNTSVVELSQQLMKLNNHSVRLLASKTVLDILGLKIKGIGPAKAVSIVAALELGRRYEAEKLNLTSFKTANDLGAYLQNKYAHHATEQFVVLYMNNAHKILHEEVVTQGGINSTVADVRIILKLALQFNAVALVVCHNHPSGSLRPSDADKQLTSKLKSAAKLMEITLLDHIIVSPTGFFSFADEGIL